MFTATKHLSVYFISVSYKVFNGQGGNKLDEGCLLASAPVVKKSTTILTNRNCEVKTNSLKCWTNVLPLLHVRLSDRCHSTACGFTFAHNGSGKLIGPFGTRRDQAGFLF